MAGSVRDDDLDTDDSSFSDEVWSMDAPFSREDEVPMRRSRRSVEDILEERRLRRQLRDVFDEDDWDH